MERISDPRNTEVTGAQVLGTNEMSGYKLLELMMGCTVHTTLESE